MKRCAIALLGLWPALAWGQQGAWDPSPFWWGNDPNGGDATLAIDLVHVWDGTTAKALSLSTGDPDSRLWTPPPVGSPPGYPGIFEATEVDTYLFCGGHSALADGRILLMGGLHSHADLFDPGTGQWNDPTAPPDMASSRYYPTATTLPNGRVLVCSGSVGQGGPKVEIPELYDLTTNSWTPQPSAQRQQPLYPYMFVLPGGNVIDAGPGETRTLSTSTWTWGPALPNPAARK